MTKKPISASPAQTDCQKTVASKSHAPKSQAPKSQAPKSQAPKLRAPKLRAPNSAAEAQSIESIAKAPAKPKVTAKPKAIAKPQANINPAMTLSDLHTTSSTTLRSFSPDNDPVLAALVAHEAEIARLQNVILALREHQVSWAQNQIIDRPSPLETKSDHQTHELSQQVDAANQEIVRLSTSLQSAWDELSSKQGHLQAAVDDCLAAQEAQTQAQMICAQALAERDNLRHELTQAEHHNTTLQSQLLTQAKRLKIALDAIARSSQS